PRIEEVDEDHGDDLETAHTAVEDPYYSQIRRDCDVKINKDKLKIQYMVKINKDESETQLLKFINENIKPDKQYGIYFINDDLEMIAYRVLLKHFNEKLKLIKTNTYTPVIDKNNFLKKLEEYHIKTYNGIQETIAYFKREMYTLNMDRLV
ncbi:hypothetical protein TSAR_006982, partial [Trichomalopsis sarcophagae]